ncbi:Uncharacterized 50 kDa protein in type I retrotransposable element R1DM [Anthophora retusa]
MSQTGETATPVRRKKRRALSSPAIASSDSSPDITATPEIKEKVLPIELRELDKIDLAIKSHLYNVRMSVPSKEVKNRTQAVDDAINYLLKSYERVTRAYVEIASKWGEFATLKQQIQEESRPNIPEEFEARINTKLADFKESIIGDVKEAIKSEIRKSVVQQVEDITKNTSQIHEDFCSNFKSTVSSEVKEAVSKVQEVVKASFQYQKPSYSAVARTGMSINTREGINNMKTHSNFEFLVVPIKDHPRKFNSASDVKKAFKEAIKPTDFDLRVNHLITLNSVAIKIMAKTVNIEELRTSENLKKIGLKIKDKERLRPRLMIRDFPLSIAFPDVARIVAEATGNTIDSTNIRVLTEFINKNRNSKSILIEVSPQVRAKLMNYGRLYLNYESCRIEDYVRVLQCFKCLKFNHLAKNCTASTATCGHCADEHNSRDCTQRNKIKCANCDRQGIIDNKHSALDPQICPILIKRKNDLIRSTDYEPQE